MGAAVGLLTYGASLDAAEAPKAEKPATNTVAGAETPAEKEAALVDFFSKKEDRTNTLGMAMVWVPAGYRVGKCEVTQQQYEELMGGNPSKFVGPQQPVERVSWTEANDFCQKLTEKERKEGKLPKTYEYALPTEKQWEYYVDNAALKDAFTSFLGDRRQPVDVGLLPANDYGLHDVRGNVWEWCSSPVARGGSYVSYEDYLQIDFRYVGTPELKYEDIGFRCILFTTEPAPPTPPQK